MLIPITHRIERRCRTHLPAQDCKMERKMGRRRGGPLTSGLDESPLSGPPDSPGCSSCRSHKKDSCSHSHKMDRRSQHSCRMDSYCRRSTIHSRSQFRKTARTVRNTPDSHNRRRLLFEKAVICFFSWLSCLAAPRSALLASVPLTPSTQPANPRARSSHATSRGQPLVISGRVRRALRPIRWGIGWSPVPGHAGHQRLCPTSRPAVSLRGSLQAGH